MKETKFKQTLVQTKKDSRHCEERSDAAIHGGFKMTEVGLIPNDWKVKPFKNVATLINGRAFSQSELLERGKYRVLRVGNFGTNDSWYYSNLELPEKMYCNKGDLLYCWSCTYGAYIWNEEKTIYHYHIWKIADLKAEKGYLQYILNNDVAQQMNSSNGSTMSHITKGFLENRLFAFPPTIEEQQRIANALSDVDTLIANLEKLIAKKKNIKQGAMQQLLTGKKHLPGFGSDERTGSRPTDERRKECHSERSAKREVEESSGYKMTELGMIPSDWNVKKLKEIGVFSKGAGISRDESNSGNIPAVRYGEIYTKHNDYIKEFYSHISQDVAEKSVKMQRGDLLFSASGETKEDIGKTIAFVDDFDAYAGGDIIIFTPTETIDSIYMGYLLNFPSIAKQKAMKAQGDAVVHITTDSLKKLIICFPSYQEQTAIANVLSDMDTEIATLETKLAKYRKLKTGMMQQLLTGKIRLI